MKPPLGYEPVQAGSDININTQYTKDNTGNHISSKNPYYCELTVLYWIWKNQNYDILGLTHHRRFFFNQKMIPQILKINEIEHILKEKDIIISKPIPIGKSIETQYQHAHIKEDYELCRDIIKHHSPEYLNAFDKNSKLPYLHPYNMLITKREILDEYCSFLFPILKELEEKIDYLNYDSYQKRVFGFLAERLLQMWIIQNNTLKVDKEPVYDIEKNILGQKIKSKIKEIL